MDGPPHVTAYEHDRVPVRAEGGLAFTPAEADHLSHLNETRPGFCERGFHQLKLANYCGVIAIGRRSLEVLPKIARTGGADVHRGTLVRLLRQVDTFDMFRHAAADHAVLQVPLLEVFIAAFVAEVARLARSGLMRRYREEEADLRVLRGAVVARRQYGPLANRIDLLACRYDEFVEDNLWNRLLRYGLALSRRWISSFDLQLRWREVFSAFEGVQAVTPTDGQLSRLIFDRQAARYRGAVEWVRWIHASLAPELRAGDKRAPGLLFDMNALSQHAIGRWLQRSRTDGRITVAEQDTGRSLATLADGVKSAFPVRPDLVMRRNGRVEVIADVKWKLLKVGRGGYLTPDESDVYQMHAYAAAYQCQRLALIYPWHSGLVGSQHTAYRLPLLGGVRAQLSIVCVRATDDGFRVESGNVDDALTAGALA